MRKINSELIVQAVKKLCIDVNTKLPDTTYGRLKECLGEETSEVGKSILGQLLENADLAKKNSDPICQDTGMAVFFVTLGQEVIIEGMTLEEAINEGVRRGYGEGYLRKSIVKDPIDRINTNDNTPAIIHIKTEAGDKLTIEFAPKGFGSENMGALKMLKPSDGLEGVRNFVIETVKNAGPNPCPPIVVGVGIGGTMEKACEIAKRALLREINTPSENDRWAEVEKELLSDINDLDIGPQGLGGKTTALAVHIETYPTHIAGLPIAVNINCHAARHGKIIL
ncbi:MAG: fumarate hydratase [Tissierellales bacterium]|jgi:fumarate hydratase subunit alpha|nr:fumarate hydratase [Tissierellales bacterium]